MAIPIIIIIIIIIIIKGTYILVTNCCLPGTGLSTGLFTSLPSITHIMHDVPRIYVYISAPERPQRRRHPASPCRSGVVHCCHGKTHCGLNSNDSEHNGGVATLIVRHM